MNRKQKKRRKLLVKYANEILKVAPEFSKFNIYPTYNILACYDKNRNRIYISLNEYNHIQKIAVSDGKKGKSLKDFNYFDAHFCSKSQIGSTVIDLLQKLETKKQEIEE